MQNFGIATELICNGSMLTQNNVENLLKNNLAKLTISIDGASKEVFEKIRANLTLIKLYKIQKILKNDIKKLY